MTTVPTTHDTSASAPTGTVTIFAPFDVGSAFVETVAGGTWENILRSGHTDPSWDRAEALFPEMSPPLHQPIVYHLAPERFHDIIHWCQVSSAQFLFFVEGIALLKLHGTMKCPEDQCRVEFDKWEGGPEGPRRPETYKAINAVVKIAADKFTALMRNAKLAPELERFSRHADPATIHEVPWILPLFFSSTPDVFGVPFKEGLTVHGDPINLVWRGGHVRTSAEKALEPNARVAIEAVFSASCLAWQSLHVLDRLLAGFLQDLVLKPLTDEHLEEQRSQRVRNIQFFSRYLLDATLPLRWTIRGELLKILREIEATWEIEDLRRSIESKTGLVALHNSQVEQRRLFREQKKEDAGREATAKAEAARSKEAKATSDRYDRNLKLFALILTGVSLYSGVANFVTLLHKRDLQPIQDWCRWNWVWAFIAASPTFLVIVVAVLLWWLAVKRERKESAETKPKGS